MSAIATTTDITSDPVECSDCTTVRPATEPACGCGATATVDHAFDCSPRCVRCGARDAVDGFWTASRRRIDLCDSCATKDVLNLTDAMGFFERDRINRLALLLREELLVGYQRGRAVAA